MTTAMQKRPRQAKRSQRSFGYTWKLEDGSLCHWAEPERKTLLQGGRPSPGAKVVRVELIEVGHKNES